MSDFIVHLNEKKKFGVDFVDRVTAGETLSNPTVKVLTGVEWDDTDQSSDILSGTPVVSGTSITFVLDPTVNIVPGTYAVVVQADTATRTLVGKAAGMRPFKLDVVG